MHRALDSAMVHRSKHIWIEGKCNLGRSPGRVKPRKINSSVEGPGVRERVDSNPIGFRNGSFLSDGAIDTIFDDANQKWISDSLLISNDNNTIFFIVDCTQYVVNRRFISNNLKNHH